MSVRPYFLPLESADEAGGAIRIEAAHDSAGSVIVVWVQVQDEIGRTLAQTLLAPHEARRLGAVLIDQSEEVR